MSVTRHTLAALLLLGACSNIGDGSGDGAADAAPDRDPDAAGADDAGLDGGGVELIEMLVVPSDGSVVTSMVAEVGATYRLVASGVFKWGGCDLTACPGGAACNFDRVGDAYHRSDDCWSSTTTGFEYVSLYLDDEQIDWGEYRTDHVYTVERVGAGAGFQFRIGDCTSCFGDNSGQLQMHIYLVP
jgi:hypothetical protein